MCEQTEVRYLDGDIVWVKLGSCWWPGHVKDVDKLPEEILVSLKKRPIAAVKFFQEETFEYVRNLNQICMYNCRRKNEFIKKGLDIYRSRCREGSTVMNKFPEDVAIAERLTGGNPDILRDNAFAPEERPDYRNIFGGDKKSGSPDKKSKLVGSQGKDRVSWKLTQLSPSANGRQSQPGSPSLPVLQQPRQITHPRFVSEVKDDTDHVVRIRHQPVSTPSRDDQSSNPCPQYKCHICDFTSNRLNVIVLHNKFHSADAANNGQGVGVKGISASKSKSADSKITGRGKGRSSVSSPSDRSRARSRAAPVSCDTPRAEGIADKSAPKRKLIEESDMKTTKEESDANSKQQLPRSPEKQLKTSERKSPKTPIFGKRKGTRWGGERPAKKKRNDEEIREKLLADWEDEDEEQEEKEIELMKQELSKSELANMHSADVAAASESERVANTKTTCSEEHVKPKETSCFDFDDTEDANLGSELEERAKKFVENRKIPRIIDDRSEPASKRRNIVDDIGTLTSAPKVEAMTETSAVQAPETLKTEVEKLSADAEDIDAAFKTLLAETTVPALPEVPELPNTNVTCPALEVGSSASLPDVVLDSNNSHTALDTNSSAPTGPKLTNVENGGGDHDYSIKKEMEEVQEKPKEIRTESPKAEVTEPHGVAGSAQTSLEDEEMELDINSMPVVMTDAIIREAPEANKVGSVPVSLIDLIPSSTELHTVGINEGGPTVTDITTVVPSSDTPVVMSKSSPQVPSSSGSVIMKASQGSPMRTIKLQAAAVPASSTVAVAVSSAAVSAISKLKGTGGTTVVSQKSGGGKFVIVQTSPGQQSRYTVGKTTQQRVTQQHIMQHAVGGSKVVILAKPQGSGQQKILTTALSPQQQKIITAGGKLQVQPQRIVPTSTGANLNPRSVMAKGTKLTPISQQQMRTLQGGKQSLGAKFTMQSTQAKVVLPTMQKASVTQASPVRVIGTLKPQSNTILIHTTQGTTVSGTVLGKTVASTSGQLQAKIGTSRSVTKLSAPKPKILTNPGVSSSVHRISVPTTGGGKIVLTSQIQPKMLESRPAVASGMVVQKVQNPLPAKSGSVGVLTNVSQLKKVSGIFPRTPSLQKLNQTTTPNQAVQKMSAPQSVQKVITSSQSIKKSVPQNTSNVNITSKRIPIVVSTTNLQSSVEMSAVHTLPSLQPLQPTVTVGPTIQQNLESNSMVLSTPQISVTAANIPVGQGNTISLPSLQPASVSTTAGTSGLSTQQIAQVVAAAPAEQLADSGTATYVLVTIDDSGTLQSYDNSTLLAYDGGSQTNEGGARTLYIDPSSIGTSGDLENIILAIDNSASSSGTVLNLGQTSTLPTNPVTSIGVENSSDSSMFGIGSAPHVSGTATPQSSGSNQDILAEALANTQVFQPDSAVQDSLTVVNSSQSTVMTPRLLESSSLLTSSPSTLHQATVLLPSLSSVLSPPSNPAGVLETSLTLNQPIMTPLEVPSAALPTLQAPPPVPSSLELPLTITQPALSVTSQAFPTIPVTASPHNQCGLSENSISESSVSNSTLSLSMAEPKSVSAVNFNPSMPLLSEETDSQGEVDDSLALIRPDSDSSAKPQSPSHTVCNVVTEKTSASMIQEAANSHIEDLLTSQAAQDAKEHSVLTSYSDIPECTSHDKKNHMNELSSTKGSVDPTSHHHVSGSVLEGAAHFCERQTVPQLQSTMVRTISVVHDHISGDTEILDSTPVTTYSVSEDTSEAAVVDNSHSSSSHLDTDQRSHISYVRVSESSSQLSGSLAPSESEIATTLPSFTEISEGTSSISKNIDHKLEMNSESDEGILENSAELLRNSSTQAVSQKVTSDECVHHTYLEIPESISSAEEKIVTDNSSEQIPDSCQSTCNSQAIITGFPKGFEDAPEVPEAQAGLEPGKEATLTSFPAESIPHVSVDASVPLQSISHLPHSMPLLVDEPLTETSNDCTEPDQVLRTNSPLEEDDMEMKNLRLEHSERSKDQGSLSPKSFPCPNLHDDEMADSDEELPPAFSSVEDGKKKNFMKDDIVWVRCNKVYWPAVVTNVSHKTRKVYVKTVNSPRKRKAIKIGFSSIIDFEDKKRNRQLFELGKRACSNFQPAYEKVKQFYVMKHHQHKLSAARYLTFEPGEVSYGTLPDMEVAEDSNSICNEECVYPLTEEELDSDPGNISNDSFGYQKSQNSYSAVTENSTSPSCSSSLSQIVKLFGGQALKLLPVCEFINQA
ncbi:uncharacterized protein LOC111872212 isoform X3 [Cryptotermes secundus]|uniref:uncharacterized protein LOC111872212 isoform X3 n=1 Tax=Cryptotermes secundus TaxID=105785 RepID=UPI001454C407|nr:uncharacterized protein LOC111872212 isoform X3 [Cryptotermes secundus]XP_033610502.1 uncharacterized protein LOC111872212 isoform X3 [Cryptotermes secundus]